MNLLVVSRNLCSFGCKRAFRVISGSFISSSRFSQTRAFYVSQHPRGTNNKMADGGALVEEYSKRAKVAVRLHISFKNAAYYPIFQLLFYLVSCRRMKL